MNTFNGYPIINDDPATAVNAFPPGYSHGYVPRDYSVDPVEMFAAPSEMKVYPESEWDARIDEQEAMKSSLEHIYLSGPNGGPAFVNLEQGSEGYCWGYSVGHCLMMARLRDNQPLIRLNPHGPCAIIKRGRNEGGWCGLSAKWARENGYPSVKTWPGHSRDLRNDTPACRAEMALYKSTEDFVDLTRDVYDQNLTFAQLATCLLNNNPCATDYMHMAHSVCAIRFIRIERGSYGILYLNSWLNWGRHGLGVLQGSKARPDGALSIRSTLFPGVAA